MLSWDGLLARLAGFDRLKARADRFFLNGEYARAHREYTRASHALSPFDHRLPTVEALRRDCAERGGIAYEAAGEVPPFHPDVHDLFELAISDKPPERALLYRNLGSAFENGYVALVQGDGRGAARELDEAASVNPSSFIVELERGRALSLAGDMEAAAAALERAVRLSPEDVEGLNLLAAVRIERRDFEGARKLLASLEARSAATPETLFLFGKALAGLGESDAALERLYEAARREPRFHEAFFEAGRILEKRGDVPGAFRAYSTACALDPEEISYNRELAQLVIHERLSSRTGLAACDRLMLCDEERRWEYLSWIAEIYVAQGWLSEARDPLRKAIDLLPSDCVRERLDYERRLQALQS